MKLSEFAEVFAKSPVKVISGYNGKVLWRKYNPEKHEEIGEREVISVWAGIESKGYGYSADAQPILCVYVNGREELVKEIAKEVETKMKEAQ